MRMEAKSCCYVNTIQTEKVPEVQQSQGSFPEDLVSSWLSVGLTFLPRVLWTKGGLGQLCVEVVSGEGVGRCFPHLPFFSKFLLIY